MRTLLAIASVLAAALVAGAAGCTGTIDDGGRGGGGADGAGGGGAGSADRFGYPVGDGTTAPAGGWVVEQVLGHYFAAWGGRHLAEDVTDPAGGAAAVDAPVHAVADGVVRYAGPNSSTYLHVVLIEHDLADGSAVCSFYGHINAPLVATGDVVTRGQPIASVADWAVAGGGPTSNTHLHYVLLSKDLCDASAAAGGGLVCGYDSGGESGIAGLDDEPARYTSVGDACGDQNYPDSFIAPSQFIAAHAGGDR